jgi:WD40 repeat protein
MWSVAFSPDGKYLAASSGTVGVTDVSLWGGHRWKGEGSVHLWRTVDWSKSDILERGFTSGARGVAFSPNGATFAATDERYDLESPNNPFVGTWVRFWDVEPWQEQTALELKSLKEASGGFPAGIAYAPDGEHLFVTMAGAPSMMVDLRNKEIKYRMALGTSSEVISFAPDGKTLVGCNHLFPDLRLYRASDGALLAALSRGTAPPKAEPLLEKTSPRGTPFSVQFSPEGDFVAAGCDDGTVYLFDSNLEKEVGQLKIASAVRAIAYSKDGQLIAVASRDRVNLFDAHSRKLLRTLGERLGGVNDIAFSPGSELLAAGCGSLEGNSHVTNRGFVRVWDVSTSRVVAELR